ncbi:MAG: diguanylate cyclase [Hylemonella sp.]|uniref:sensor domain-containing diguanylate cyclase n=1 Tax=Hylemonella sp. TaxID=2066020 RepID=UPI00391A8AF0
MPLAWASAFNPRSFRGRLTLWFGGLSLATLLSVGLYVGHIATEELADFGGQTLHISARSAADLLAANLNERDKEIRLLAQLPPFTRGDLRNPDLGRALDLRIQASGEYAWIGITDVQGVVLQATGGLLVGQNVSQRPWFQAALQGPYTGDVHEALLLAKQFPQRGLSEPLRFIDFAAPILDERGRLRGVLSAHAHWSWVTDTVESVVTQRAMRRQVEVLIADKAGRILYPFRHAATLQLPARERTSAPYEVVRWQDGKTYLTSMAELSAQTSTPLGWRIVLRQPLQVAVEPMQILHQQLLFFGLITALVFALIAYRLATRVSQPIEQLAQAMHHIERGDQPPVYPRDGEQVTEIRQLSDSIQSMTGALLRHERELEAVNASLEQQVRERTEALSIANQELERLATVDSLTGLNNRRRFDARLHESFQLMRRTERSFCLMLIDVDHFKAVNDQYGHQSGDEVLRRLGHLLTQCTRVTDFVARYGGEEFVVLLPDVQDEDEGRLIAEKIRTAIAGAVFPSVGRLTASVGLSCARKGDTDSAEVVERADKALYTAKELGRNRVVQL